MRAMATDSRRGSTLEKPRVLVNGRRRLHRGHLVPYLATRGYRVIAASRANHAAFDHPNVVMRRCRISRGCSTGNRFWEQCDAVVHLAGIAHKYAGDDFYDRVNHRATSALARAISRSSGAETYGVHFLDRGPVRRFRGS